jgi:hypothetical protein
MLQRPESPGHLNTPQRSGLLHIKLEATRIREAIPPAQLSLVYSMKSEHQFKLLLEAQGVSKTFSKFHCDQFFKGK